MDDKQLNKIMKVLGEIKERLPIEEDAPFQGIVWQLNKNWHC